MKENISFFNIHIFPDAAPEVPPTHTNPAPPSSICLVSQEQTLHPNTSATLQENYLPSLSQSFPVDSQTSMLQNTAGMEQTAMINGSVQGNPQGICVAQRQLEGEKLHEQQQHRQKILMKQQRLLLMQLQQVASRISQHGYHNKQITHADLPSIDSVQSSRYLCRTKATRR